jgi:hypothetical protein
VFRFEREDEKITSEEMMYWKRIVRSNLKIGVEIECSVSNRFDGYDVQTQMKRFFNASGNYGKFQNFGVINVKGDGSVPNGFELCTTGRRIDFLDLYVQYKVICDKIFTYEPQMTQKCGLHNHIMLDYMGDSYNSMEKNMPGVIFKNFMQLMRSHLPEIVWMTSTVKDANAITRQANFCKSDTLYNFTPLTSTLSTYVTNVIGGDRYRAINLRPLVLSGNEISKFHMEFRFPDGSIYPAQIAGQNMIYMAMLIKAIEVSEIGLINCGTREEWEETKRLMNVIRTIRPGIYGDSERVSMMPSGTDIEKFKIRSRAMLSILKPILDSFDTHIYGVLQTFADKPISLQRHDASDAQINETYLSMIKTMYGTDLSDCTELIKAINTGEYTAPTKQSWGIQFASKNGETVESLNRKLFKLSQNRNIDFDPTLGTYVFK